MTHTKKIKIFFERIDDILKPGQTVGYLKDNDMSAHEYRIRFEKELKKLNNEEFIVVFNRCLHTARCYGVIIQARQNGFLNELERRNIDYSAIRNENSITFSKKVELVEDKLHLL
jgi:hypothetical protein